MAGSSPPNQGSSLPIERKHARGRSAGARVVLAQESGLVLVIVVVMVLLTVFGGQKRQVDTVVVPAGAGVADENGVYVVTGADGKTERYSAADGWEMRGTPEQRTLRRERQVNKFFNLDNFVLLAKDASFIAIMAVGMTAIIVMGGIDLSVGSTYALAAVIGAMALKALQAHWLGVPAEGMVASAGGAPWWASIAVGLGVCCGVGALAGAANGAMVVGLRVHPFIITLGTMAVLRGIVFIRTQGESIIGFPDSFMAGFLKAPIWGVHPVPVFLMLGVVLVGALVLSRTVLGRRIYAIGGNETAAVYAGVPVGRVKVIAFTVGGLLAGLSAAVYLGYYGAASPDAGQGYELRVIAASVIGGASLSGGRGSAVGALLGAVLIQLITNAMVILDIDTNYTDIVMGTAIIVAVVLDQAKSRLAPAGR